MVKTLTPEHKEKLRLGREKKLAESKQGREAQKEIVETIREIVKLVPEPRLEGFELYRALKEKGFPQGGGGENMEDVNGTEIVYIPTYGEVIAFFIADPNKMYQMRDAVIRAYIELA